MLGHPRELLPVKGKKGAGLVNLWQWWGIYTCKVHNFAYPPPPLMETDDIWVLRKAKVQFDSLNNLDGMIIIIMCKTIIILNIFERRLQNNSTVSVEN